MSFTLKDIAQIIGASWEEPPIDNPVIEYLLTDSRRLLFPSATLFFALPGTTKQGIDFIEALYQKGQQYFVVPVTYHLKEKLKGAIFLKVTDCLQALQQIAAAQRNKFSYPVIGITGSNGKTIVKEWLYHLLSNDYNITRSPRSFNSQTGVPLSVWQMNENNNLAIFEAGISLPGEMDRLQKMINPGIGILTFIGEAHAEGFPGRREKINEKLKLFIASSLLIYNKDQQEVDDAVKQFVHEKNKTLETFTWGQMAKADLLISDLNFMEFETVVNAIYKTKNFTFTLPFTDKASVHNVLTCISVMLYLGYSASIINERVKPLKPIAMRLEQKQGINNCSIINDSYNTDINSLQVALDFLQQQQQHHKQTLILSDLLQSGMEEEKLYASIAAILHKKNLFRFIGIGIQLKKYASFFHGIPHIHFFDSTEALLANLPFLHLQNETILLKAARIFQFEKVSRALEQKMHETYLEIDLNALRHNYKTFKSFTTPSVKMMAMVKAFSYGSGSYEIASLLQHAGADYLGVAYADEGVELRKAGILVPIMVMNTEEAGFDKIIQYNLEPELYSFNILLAFKNYLLQHGIKSYKVHLKLDTGMHRLGFEAAAIPPLCSHLKDAACFQVASVFSHLVGSAEMEHDDFTQFQYESFLQMAREIENVLNYRFIRHIANSAAIKRFPKMQLDMVRLGIGLYGIDRDKVTQSLLKNVTTLKTTISQIRQINKGESIGYSRAAIMPYDGTIATVRIGYADGYPRSLGNGAGKMLVNGQLASVLGSVCMDMLMLDVTGIEVAEEDEVIVFGEELTVTMLANWANTIPYEILTNISQRVRRVYYQE
ncbi:MAG: bifunctional UDP-N-acetylmuramoyl-tripeptide:D-alanyl-D-alanine ligase/alanine racemase [Niastella sp.]|nr:bifunctional UDP-N-acetylmuramoyl-tripeptide:D-alanyl-D-alanine ligase/alanine racemase [Niastella sp.]